MARCFLALLIPFFISDWIRCLLTPMNRAVSRVEQAGRGEELDPPAARAEQLRHASLRVERLAEDLAVAYGQLIGSEHPGAWVPWCLGVNKSAA